MADTVFSSIMKMSRSRSLPKTDYTPQTYTPSAEISPVAVSSTPDIQAQNYNRLNAMANRPATVSSAPVIKDKTTNFAPTVSRADYIKEYQRILVYGRISMRISR